MNGLCSLMRLPVSVAIERRAGYGQSPARGPPQTHQRTVRLPLACYPCSNTNPLPAGYPLPTITASAVITLTDQPSVITDLPCHHQVALSPSFAAGRIINAIVASNQLLNSYSTNLHNEAGVSYQESPIILSPQCSILVRVKPQLPSILVSVNSQPPSILNPEPFCCSLLMCINGSVYVK